MQGLVSHSNKSYGGRDKSNSVMIAQILFKGVQLCNGFVTQKR